MSEPRYRALRILLGFLSLLTAIGGIVLVFSSKGIVLRVFLHPPESEVSTLLLAAIKEMGGLLLMLSTMLFLAARDPIRNVAIVDALAIGLGILAVTTEFRHGTITPTLVAQPSRERMVLSKLVANVSKVRRTYSSEARAGASTPVQAAR